MESNSYEQFTKLYNNLLYLLQLFAFKINHEVILCFHIIFFSFFYKLSKLILLCNQFQNVLVLNQ